MDQQNRTPGSKLEAANKGGSQFDLSEEIDRNRYQGRRDLERTPIEKLASRNPLRGLSSLTPTAADNSFSKIFDRTPKSYVDEEVGVKVESKRSTLGEIVSFNRVHEFEEALNGASLLDFDGLPTKYDLSSHQTIN